jgi:hypothetical protein
MPESSSALARRSWRTRDSLPRQSWRTPGSLIENLELGETARNRLRNAGRTGK